MNGYALPVRISQIAIALLMGGVGCKASDSSKTQDAAVDTTASSDAATTTSACQQTSDCVLVHWGCCEDHCEYPTFTVAVNKAAVPGVVRVTGCGQVCAPKGQCSFQLSAACESNRCVTKCSGQCPAARPME
jgi:hypothetical protein